MDMNNLTEFEGAFDLEEEISIEDIINESPTPIEKKKLKLPKITKEFFKTKKAKIIAFILAITIVLTTVTASYYYNAPTKDINEDFVLEVSNNVATKIRHDSLSSLSERIPAYSIEDIYALNLTEPTNITAEDLRKVLQQGLVGLEDDFINSGNKYNVNPVFLVSIAVIESGWGTVMFMPNNMFGYGRFSFNSKAECIDAVAKGLGENYLSEGGSLFKGKTIVDVNKFYASNPLWYVKVGGVMQSLYNTMRENNVNAVEKLK